MSPLRYLSFDRSEDADGVVTLEALAATPAARHADVMAEVRRVLDWAGERFPHTHGPVDDGMDWDDDLQVVVEEGGWHAVALTLTGSRRFADELLAAFGDGSDGAD
ncbi:MAG TPA: hypothetical protein VMR43_04095 [Variovorax sp.]|jgi:hypothetical protein|nr:hypothetical protein [Variovorax sp.]